MAPPAPITAPSTAPFTPPRMPPTMAPAPAPTPAVPFSSRIPPLLKTSVAVARILCSRPRTEMPSNESVSLPVRSTRPAFSTPLTIPFTTDPAGTSTRPFCIEVHRRRGFETLLDVGGLGTQRALQSHVDLLPGGHHAGAAVVGHHRLGRRGGAAAGASLWGGNGAAIRRRCTRAGADRRRQQQQHQWLASSVSSCRVGSQEKGAIEVPAMLLMSMNLRRSFAVQGFGRALSARRCRCRAVHADSSPMAARRMSGWRFGRCR